MGYYYVQLARQSSKSQEPLRFVVDRLIQIGQDALNSLARQVVCTTVKLQGREGVTTIYNSLKQARKQQQIEISDEFLTTIPHGDPPYLLLETPKRVGFEAYQNQEVADRGKTQLRAGSTA
jgi:hypothetical protein